MASVQADQQSKGGDGQKTSVSLEDGFWDALNEIAEAKGKRRTDVISAIDHARPARTALSSALRLFVLDYYRSSIDNKKE